MARPKREIVMARCAREALFAAVEIYNKPRVEFREQTVAFLLVNAWEVLLKARIVQQNGGKIQSIYQRKSNSRRFKYSDDGEALTINIRGALNRSSLPEDAKSNIKGLNKIRNRATHLGVLLPELKLTILEYSTASVQNFVKIYTNWFQEAIEVPYLLPLGFVGNAPIALTTYPARQKELLNELSGLAKFQSSVDSGYSVVLQVKVELNRGISGGGNIGLTNAPNVPRVSISDDEALKAFPSPYKELVATCKDRYVYFKQNQYFHSAMTSVNSDPNCAYERKLDPTSKKSPTKRFYNLAACPRNNFDYEYRDSKITYEYKSEVSESNIAL